MLAQATVNGILLGGLYGLATVGFSMVWGVMGVINLAHTAFITLGAYVTYVLFERYGVDPLLSMPLAMASMFVLGYGIQRLILNHVIRTSLLLSLVVTFGIELVLTDATVLIFTSDVRSVNASYASSSVAVFGTLVPVVRLLAAGLSLALGVGFFVFLRRASLGQAILATALDREMSNLMGINPQQVFALTAGAGAALAGAAGSLSSMLFPVSPTMGVSFLGAVFVITVLGGIGSVEGCIVAGFLYGLVQAWAAYWLGTSFQEIVAFAMFLGVLVVRPQGLFGRAFFGEHA
ncbi:branched-chain amino acid ABC transporter permease [Bradyrhizobium sp. Arg237L]|uniref:branched-chain amino acid ABC transporter permease n=1 Tax=Bradyrhizobium sp. Arg237L TaxID=3003352 RepID=UPI00249DF45F|nr:branched-chain amino acid ABC transporter permease [Bradyrhizobium sp. Arg237L]MDI4231824.1 branched-chain amino acid ABC transporter permease [Bradyrhizobium sp. Arg237L]